MSSDGIRVRVQHTHHIVMEGWTRAGKGEYHHLTGRRVRRDDRGCWESIGGLHDGQFWQSMHWAMIQALR
jgi:hypothetical protein